VHSEGSQLLAGNPSISVSVSFPFSIVYTFLQFLFYFIFAISLVPNSFPIKLLLGAFGVYKLKIITCFHGFLAYNKQLFNILKQLIGCRPQILV